MELAEVIEALRRSWWVVLTGAVLGLFGAVVANATATVQYQAEVQQFVSFADQGESSANALSGAQFTLQRVKSYTQIATSAQVLDPVVRQLRLPTTGKALATQVTATNPLDTVLIQIAVTDSNPRRAAEVANAVAAQFGQVVEELERPPGGGDSPVKVSITQPASTPSVPVAPRAMLNLALGLLVGLGLGTGGAVLRARLDTTVKSAADIEALTGAVPLGVVPVDPQARTSPLVIRDPSGVRAEAFKALRTNLQFADVDHPPRVVVVTSPMAGDGKSSSACNIALTLALNGARVVLVEADLRRPLACDYLGLDNAVGLTSVLAGQIDLASALVSWNRGLLDVLPSGPVPPNPSELLGSKQLESLLHVLRAQYEFVVIDTAPLLPVTDAAVLSTVADGALVVMRHGVTTREQAERAVQSLAAVNARLLGTMLNFAPRRRRMGRYAYEYQYRPAAAKADHRFGPSGHSGGHLLEPAGHAPAPVGQHAHPPGPSGHPAHHSAPAHRGFPEVDLLPPDHRPPPTRPPTRPPAPPPAPPPLVTDLRDVSGGDPLGWLDDPGSPGRRDIDLRDGIPEPRHPGMAAWPADAGQVGIGTSPRGRHRR